MPATAPKQVSSACTTPLRAQRMVILPNLHMMNWHVTRRASACLIRAWSSGVMVNAQTAGGGGAQMGRNGDGKIEASRRGEGPPAACTHYLAHLQDSTTAIRHHVSLIAVAT